MELPYVVAAGVADRQGTEWEAEVQAVCFPRMQTTGVASISKQPLDSSVEFRPC